MHGSVDLTNVTRILALDLGKFNSVLCIYDPATQQHQFATFQTTPQVVHDLLVKYQTKDPAQTLVVMETCDVSGWIHDIAVALGICVAIANCSHEAWRWSRVKRKTDKDDALKLARLTLLKQLPTVHMPSPQQRQRRRLVHYRRVLVDRRTSIRNQIRSIYSQQGMSLPRRARCWSKPGIEQLSKEARAFSECSSIDELWRGRLHTELKLLSEISQQIDLVEDKLDQLGAEDDRIKLLQSVPGVGPRLSETLVAHIDDPHRFKNAAQVASYAGLVPKQMESGTVKRSGRITRRGPALLRSMLVEVAWMVYMRCDWARSFVQRISGGIAGRKKIAIVALARKLLVMLWAMLRDNRAFVDPTSSPPEDTAPVTAVSSVVALG